MTQGPDAIVIGSGFGGADGHPSLAERIAAGIVSAGR